MDTHQRVSVQLQEADVSVIRAFNSSCVDTCGGDRNGAKNGLQLHSGGFDSNESALRSRKKTAYN
jgi:hypothetical protein